MKGTTAVNTGEKLRALREAAGLKQYDVAEAAGFRGPVFCEIESGKRTVSPTTVVMLIQTIMTLREESGEAYRQALVDFGLISPEPQDIDEEARA